MSVLVSAPLIALIYILSTAGVLAYTAPEKIDLAATVAQTLQRGFGASVIAFSGPAQSGARRFTKSSLARTPVGMAFCLAGGAELHPTFRTPAKAIAVVAASLGIAGGLSLLGEENQEAIQVLLGVAYGCYCVMYLLLFRAVLFGFRDGLAGADRRLRVEALSAFFVTIVCLVFQVVPVADVANLRVFALKVLAGICLATGLGAFF
ncbi:MAG: hypothetical protein JO108_30670 [Acidobacteriaceae bacterium]|nr:hypothetical protein [Acidobacteriaceae bacterium]